MGIGVATDFKIYQEQYYGGMYESVVQNIAVFNAATRNGMVLVARDIIGDYSQESFFNDIANMVTRRDLTSTAAATALGMTQGELVSVKINRKVGPIDQTLDSWRKIGKTDKEMSYLLGKMVGEKKLEDYVNTSILALDSAMSGIATLNHTVAGTLTHSILAVGLSKFGDAAQQIVCWLMHSKNYFDLVGQSIADKIDSVAGATIYSGTVATLGRPTVVSDSPSLITSGTPDTYGVLGLVSGGVVCTESEQEEIVSEVVTGGEQLVFRVQGEHAYNIGMKGFAWDIANGGKNPLDAAVGTATNWDQVATSVKSLPGVRISVQ